MLMKMNNILLDVSMMDNVVYLHIVTNIDIAGKPFDEKDNNMELVFDSVDEAEIMYEFLYENIGSKIEDIGQDFNA